MLLHIHGVFGTRIPKNNLKMKKSNLFFIILGVLAMFTFASCSNTAESPVSYLPVVLEGNNTDALHILNVKSGEIIATDATNVTDVSLFYGDWATIEVEEDGVTYYNFMNTKGKLLNGNHYKYATVMNDDRAWVVMPGGHIILIDSKGKEIATDKNWLKAYPFYNGLSVVKDAQKGWVVVNKSGKIDETIPYPECLPIVVDNLVSVSGEDREGYDAYGIYILGKSQQSLLYDDVAFSGDDSYINYVNGVLDGRILVEKDNKWGVINRKGKIKINPHFSNLIYDGDYYMCEKDDWWGWCDASGKYLINPQYDAVKAFNGHKLAPAKDSYTYDWGFVDKKGVWVINPQFDNVSSFQSNGLAMAKIGDDWGLIDKKGKWVVNPQYEEMYAIDGQNNYIVSFGRGAYVLVNSKGETLSQVPFVFDEDILLDKDYFEDYGLSNFAPVESDYVDYELIADKLVSMTGEMVKTTSGAIKKKLGGASAFKHGEVLIQEIEDKHYSLKLKAYCSPWEKEYYGWWYYETVFNSKKSVSKYKMILELKGTASDNYEEFVNYLNQKFEYNAEEETVVIGGKTFDLATDRSKTVITMKLQSKL